MTAWSCKNGTVATLHRLAQVVGQMVASFPGVQFGELYYRRCDNLKNQGLKEHRGDYSKTIGLTEECKVDLVWWIENIEHTTRQIVLPEPAFKLESDASKTGWGGCLVLETGRQSTGGNWSAEEADLHINKLELLAAWFTIQCFCADAVNCHIKIASDNTTTVAYINNLGGTKPECSEIARKIGIWCFEKGNWITAVHLPGVENTTADKESRSVHDNTEWQLHSLLFEKICDKFGMPDIDLFASRLNAKVPKYCSWRPDPGAYAVDSLAENWSNWLFYAFPPFSLIGKVLQKIETEQATGILLVPFWPTQPWFSKFTQLCKTVPVILFSRQAQPTLNHPWRQPEELPKNLRMIASLVSGRPSISSASTVQQDASSWSRGDLERESNICQFLNTGPSIVLQGELVKIHQI